MTEVLSPSSVSEAVLTIFDLGALCLAVIGLPILIVELIGLWRQRRLDWRRGSGLLTSLFCLVPVTAAEILSGGALYGAFFSAATFSPRPVPTDWASALLCLLLVDLIYYWEHRLGHEVNALWALYHSVHHSGDHFDQTIAVRGSIFDVLVTPLFYLPLVLAGFHPLLVLTCFGLVLAWQQWIHTELVGRLPLLDPWLNTPSNHRVHHGRNPQYLDKNYGGVLMIWDRLFGSYEPERERVDYGLVEPLTGRNPFTVQFHLLVKLTKALVSSGSVGAALRILIGRPGDRPEATKAPS